MSCAQLKRERTVNGEWCSGSLFDLAVTGLHGGRQRLDRWLQCLLKRAGRS